MIVQRKTHRRRIVKGHAFMDLSAEDQSKVTYFLETGDSDYLPERFKGLVETVVKQKLPKWAD